jgi:hypothetical protein
MTERGVECGMHGKYEHCIQNCSRENRMEDAARNILTLQEDKFTTRAIKTGFESVNVINWAHSRDQ